MRYFVGVLIVLATIVVMPAFSQVDPTTTDTSGTTQTDTTATTDTAPPAQPLAEQERNQDYSPPGWVTLVRPAAVIGPWGVLAAALLVGFFIHWGLVTRQQNQFPRTRGSRSPQMVPVIVSACLFLLLGLLFIFFEVKARGDILAQHAGVVDQWRPVTRQAVISYFACFLLAVVPWVVLTKRADRYYPGEGGSNA
jgi:hypothetical protein